MGGERGWGRIRGQGGGVSWWGGQGVGSDGQGVGSKCMQSMSTMFGAMILGGVVTWSKEPWEL